MTTLTWPSLALNPLAALGLLLAAGVLGARLLSRATDLPALTGYVLTGLIIGPAGLRLLNADLLLQAELFVQLALGLALFDTGRRIDLHWLRREGTLLISTVLYATLVFAGLYTALQWAGLDWSVSAMMAALGMATSPIVILELLRETRAEGQLTERLTAITGLTALMSYTVFALAIGSARVAGHQSTEDSLLSPAWLVLAALALGVAAGLATIPLRRWLGAREREQQQVLLFGLIALVVGAAAMIGTLPSLAMLVFGLATRNLQGGLTLTEPGLSSRSQFFFVAFFVAAGAQLMPRSLTDNWLPALLFLGLRSGLGLLFWCVAASANGLARARGLWLGLALNPLSGGAAMLMSLGILSVGSHGSRFAGTMMAVFVISEIVGPILTRLALDKAGESQKEA
ncbi:cation:proton antiporter [uncultured Aquitalea sp.]|uniref:cation:proton antiporter n=1 Tax=uncultured Aquitalea sp. TaxID=540272 RepID=UPI0025EF50B1|nr:cation:proton antiporter [uncultured Aquitalea sp.]